VGTTRAPRLPLDDATRSKVEEAYKLAHSA
jgi:hypothetical protein